MTTIPLWIQFLLNENDKALAVCTKYKRLDMYEYWFAERLKLYDRYFSPRLSDEEYATLSIY